MESERSEIEDCKYLKWLELSFGDIKHENLFQAQDLIKLDEFKKK